MTVARNVDGRLEVFALGTDHALIHIWQETPNGPTWSRWETLAGAIDRAPAVSRNADGRLQVFARAQSVYPSAIVHISQTAPGRAPWSPWSSLGGSLKGVPPVVARNQEGQLEVFARTQNDTLSHNWQVAPNGDAWSGWSDFQGSRLFGQPFAIANANGNLELFAMGPEADLVHRTETAQTGVWSAWESLGGRLFHDPAVGRNADGRLEAFSNADGFVNELTNVWQTLPGTAWGNWWLLDSPLGNDSPTVARNADGRLELFVRSSDDKSLWHKWQTAPNNGWSKWHPLGGILGSRPAVALNADGRLEVFAVGRGHYLYHIWQTAPNGDWSGWERLGDWVTNDFGTGFFDL